VPALEESDNEASKELTETLNNLPSFDSESVLDF
jgi:hypothetical protein